MAPHKLLSSRRVLSPACQDRGWRRLLLTGPDPSILLAHSSAHEVLG